jgi:hypothetical protein
MGLTVLIPNAWPKQVAQLRLYPCKEAYCSFACKAVVGASWARGPKLGIGILCADGLEG